MRQYLASLRSLSCGALAFLATAAFAEDGPQTADSEKLEEVIVTGSNIRGAELGALTPLQVVDRDALLASSAGDLSQILSNVPANAGSTLYNESGQLVGTAQFNLRGLGYSSTLLLVNGRRAGVAPLSDKSGADFVDINQFPLGMVERIDVLKDGSSAIYGSEAVAGVVNIVTRKGFKGLEFSGDYSSSSNDTYSLSIAGGTASDRGHVNLYATYYYQDRNTRSDFDWLIDRIGGGGTLGRSQLLSSSGFPPTVARGFINASGRPQRINGAPSSPDANCEAAGGVFRINDNGSVERATCFLDFTDQISIVPEERHLMSFIEIGYDLADSLHYFGELSGARNINLTDKQLSTYSNGLAVGGSVYIPANHPFNFFVADSSRPNGVRYVDPGNWNPLTDVAVDLIANMRPAGTNYTGERRQENTNFRTVNGFDFELSSSWRATLAHTYSYAKYEGADSAKVNSERFNARVLDGTFNPFGTAVVDPALVSPKNAARTAGNGADVLGDVFYTARDERRTEQQVVDGSVSTALGKLPYGSVNLAVGAQYRRQSLDVFPDSLVAAGKADTPDRDSAFSGTQDVTAEYAEVVIPYAEHGQLQAALRHEDYGGAIGRTTDPKLAAGLDLFDGVLGVRGSWGTSFQAPTLTQSARSQALVIINDPVVFTPSGFACTSALTANNTLVVTSGGALEPQKSRNYTAGFTLRPASGLSVAADYWQYDYDNLIAAGQNGQAIVNGECVNGQYRPDSRVVRATNSLIRIETAYQNIGAVKTDGLDLSLTYQVPILNASRLALRADATYTSSFEVDDGRGVTRNNVGNRNFTNNFFPIPRWRGTLRAQWTRGAHDIGATAHFTSGYRNDQSNNAPVGSYTPVDLQYSYAIASLGAGAARISLGVDNVLDEEPPALLRYDSTGNLVRGTIQDIDRPGYDPLAGASVRGRIAYARLLYRF